MAVSTRSAGSSAGTPALQNPYSKLPDWFYPTSVVVVLTAFSIYGIWVTFFQHEGRWGPYGSPFYSPEFLSGLLKGTWFNFPAVLTVPWPLLFRGTCYYYRKAYFRSFFGDPRTCACEEKDNGRYRGETALPWVLNNLHRYTFYITVLVTFFLAYDALVSFWYQGHFHIGIGSVLMVINVVLLAGYTYGCHAYRHLAGGRIDQISCSPIRYQLWLAATRLNERHAAWAWVSMFSVAFVDIYIRLGMHGYLGFLGGAA